MQTIEEIVAYYERERQEDIFGFLSEVLLRYLPTEAVKPFLKEGTDLSAWQPTPLTEEAVIADMGQYMAFAWGKVSDHRGISAYRSIEKMQGWLWLLGDEETLAYAKDEEHYPQYGAPILLRICQRYGFPVPDEEGIRNMAQGKPCYPGCQEGCGR